MARKTLTQLTVEKFRPDPAREIERADHLYPALRLRIYPSGARSFWLRTRIAGRTANLRLADVGLDLTKARVTTRDLLARIDAGEDPRVASRKVKATTLGGVAELYLKHSADEVGPRTQVERVRHLTRDWKPLHHRPIAEIKKGEVALRLLEIKDEHGPIAANRSRTTLYGLFNWALDQDLIEVNVVASTRRPLKEEPVGSRTHSPEEREEILSAAEGDCAYNAIVQLLWFTGQRKSEIGGMRWSELELDKAMWWLPPERVKNRLPHVVPLSRQVIEIIKVQPHRGEYVFGERGDAPFSGWSRCKRRLDRRILEARRAKDREAKPMPPWTIHDIRRSTITGMNDLGVLPHVVESIVNHVSGAAKKEVAGTYNRAEYVKERTVALQVWADHITGAPETKVVEYRARAS